MVLTYAIDEIYYTLHSQVSTSNHDTCVEVYGTHPIQNASPHMDNQFPLLLDES